LSCTSSGFPQLLLSHIMFLISSLQLSRFWKTPARCPFFELFLLMSPKASVLLR
jgi:hypothetical protein